MRESHFDIKDLVIMAVFGAMGGSFRLSTVFVSAAVPVNVPGFGGIIFIPFSTVFLFVGFGLVGKWGSATITSTILGFVSFLLPGGPGILALPVWLLKGLVIDGYLWIIHRKVHDSRLVAGSAAFLPYLTTTWWIMWIGFDVFFGRILPVWIFIIVFTGLHGVLSVIGGIGGYHVLRRMRGVTSY